MDRLLASCSCWFCLFVYFVCDQSAIRTAGCACVRPHVANFFFWGGGGVMMMMMMMMIFI